MIDPPGSVPTFPYCQIGHGTACGGSIQIQAAADAPATIGKYCALGPGLVVITHNHGTNYPACQYALYRRLWGTSHPALGKPSRRRSKGPVVMGSDVWTGREVLILSGVRIGNGAVIGARAVVTHDVSPYAIVAGVPARPIGHRFGVEVCAWLAELGWWDWPEDRIERNREFFFADLNALRLDQIKELIKD